MHKACFSTHKNLAKIIWTYSLWPLRTWGCWNQSL